MPRKKKIQNPEDMPALQRLREEAGLTQAQLAKLIPDKTRTGCGQNPLLKVMALEEGKSGGIQFKERTIVMTKFRN